MADALYFPKYALADTRYDVCVVNGFHAETHSVNEVVCLSVNHEY